MTQSQASLEEQLLKLRILAEDAEYPITRLTQPQALQLAAIANKNGLYDAADYIQNYVSALQPASLVLMFRTQICIGAFGVFNAPKNLKWLKDIWETLETLYHDTDWWIGCYSAYDVIRWGKVKGVLTLGEYDKLFNLLQN